MEGDASIISVTTMGRVECGKTCLIKRYCEGRFENRYIPTIALDYGMQPITVKNRQSMVDDDDREDYIRSIRG